MVVVACCDTDTAGTKPQADKDIAALPGIVDMCFYGPCLLPVNGWAKAVSPPRAQSDHLSPPH